MIASLILHAAGIWLKRDLLQARLAAQSRPEPDTAILIGMFAPFVMHYGLFLFCLIVGAQSLACLVPAGRDWNLGGGWFVAFLVATLFPAVFTIRAMNTPKSLPAQPTGALRHHGSCS